MYKIVILCAICFLLIYCSSKKEDKSIEIIGKVIEKYRDYHNHGSTTIVCENDNGQIKYQIDEWSINSDLWDYLQTGDSIIKPSGTLTLKIIKPNGDSKEYEYQR